MTDAAATTPNMEANNVPNVEEGLANKVEEGLIDEAVPATPTIAEPTAEPTVEPTAEPTAAAATNGTTEPATASTNGVKFATDENGNDPFYSHTVNSANKPAKRVSHLEDEKQKLGLSVVSKMYDIDGDGKLDEAEMAMRNMDTSGKGYLTNEKVYKIMQEQMQTQRELFKFKKVVAGLAGFVVLLTLSNLGTSIAAAYLAKDTSTNTKNQLTSSSNGETLGTQTTSDTFHVKKETIEGSEGGEGTDSSGRALCERVSGGWGSWGSFSDCETTSYIAMDAEEARQMICRCMNDHTVNLFRTWVHNNKVTKYPFCNPDMVATFAADCDCAGVGSSSDGSSWGGWGGSWGTATDAETGVCSSATFGERPNEMGISANIGGGTYSIWGDAFLQNEGEDCDDDGDCDAGLACQETNCFSAPCDKVCTVPPPPTASPTPSPTPSPVGGGIIAGLPALGTPCDIANGDDDCKGEPLSKCLDLSGDKNFYCACVDGTSDGCSDSVYSMCYGGNTCGCDTGNDLCGNLDAKYTCGIDCGIAGATPSCAEQTSRDGYCDLQKSGSTCDAGAGACV